MLLDDEKHFIIVLSAIRDYESGTNDIGILIVEKVINEIINCVDIQFDTQDVFDEIVEVFNYYNDFVEEKGIDMRKIPDGMIDLLEHYVNEVVKDVGKTQN